MSDHAVEAAPGLGGLREQNVPSKIGTNDVAMLALDMAIERLFHEIANS